MYSSHTTTTVLAILSALPILTLAQTPATTTITAPSQPTSSSYTSDDQFKKDALFAHNFYRSAHNASDLTWNETSARFAEDWSDECNFKHSGGPLGENLAMGYANVTAAIEGWALERKDYDWGKPGFKAATGHFTQLVWRNTTSVGCARTRCDGKNDAIGWMVVCEYWPQGNVLGADNSPQFFKDNVLQQTEGQKTDTVASGVTSAGAGARDGLWSVGVLIAAGVVSLGMAW